MSIKNVRIADCADVRPGFSAKSAIENDPQGTLQVITAQHIAKGEVYRYDKDHSLLITPPKFYEKYLVTAGDVLFMSRGISNHAVLIESVPDPTIAPLSFFIMKPKQNVLSEYLVWYLNQDMMKGKLNEIRSGAGTPMISSKEFRELSIPLPPLATQKKIAALWRLQMYEKLLLQQLANETDRLNQAIGRALFLNSNHPKG
jgi:restriction endonuclease S subunit